MKTIIGIICLMMLASCDIYYPDITKAEGLCKNNDGVNRINVGPFYFDAYCVDGAIFIDQRKNVK